MQVVVNMSSLPVYKKYRIASILCIFETTLYIMVNSSEDPDEMLLFTSGSRASDFFQDCWTKVTHGAKNGGSFLK